MRSSYHTQRGGPVVSVAILAYLDLAQSDCCSCANRTRGEDAQRTYPKREHRERTHNGVIAPRDLPMQVRRVFVLPSLEVCCQSDSIMSAPETLGCYAKRRSDRCLQRRECCERFAEPQWFHKTAPPVSSGTGRVASTNLAPTGVILALVPQTRLIRRMNVPSGS